MLHNSTADLCHQKTLYLYCFMHLSAAEACQIYQFAKHTHGAALPSSPHDWHLWQHKAGQPVETLWTGSLCHLHTLVATTSVLVMCSYHSLAQSFMLLHADRYTANAKAMSAGSAGPPLVFLSSFDFSCLEFRVLLPLLEEAGAEAWAVDIAGWGFTEAGVLPGSQQVLGPAERREHLLEFCKQKVSHILPACLQYVSQAILPCCQDMSKAAAPISV